MLTKKINLGFTVLIAYSLPVEKKYGICEI